MYKIGILIYLSALMISCDPFYSITVTNKTTETAKILVKESNNFSTDKHKTQTTDDGFDVYELSPNENMGVGSAIAEIDDEIPFEAIKIIRYNDTISANTPDEIKNLFDKKTSGELITPYNLTIK
ncbi:MAG: hypothetical protein ACE364_01135 [Chlorobiota bacterium]